MLQRLHVLTLLMYWALSFAIIASYMIYSVGFCSKQLAKPGFTHMWQTLEVISTL